MYRKDSEGWLKHADFIVLDGYSTEFMVGRRT